MTTWWRNAPAAVHLLAALLLAACTPAGADRANGPATLVVADETLELAVTGCALVAGRLTEQLPPLGTEVTVVAEGQDAAGREVRVTARRGTDVVAPHRFELLEISRGQVEEHLEVVVVLRGYDRDTGSWTQVDPDAPNARRAVARGLFDIEGARLVARGSAARAPDGDHVPVDFEAVCPPELERDPGVAAP